MIPIAKPISNRIKSTHFLHSNSIYASREPSRISTVLGSCVSVCLWDKQYKFGGMNHYLLPLWNGDGLASPKFGNIAIDKLIQRMQQLGSNKNQLIAKILGGASISINASELFRVGQRNITMAIDLMTEYDIPVVGSDVGGNFGRKILFDTLSGRIKVNLLQPTNKV